MNLSNSDKEKIKDWIYDPDRTADEARELYTKYGNNQNIHRLIGQLNYDKKVISILDTQLRQMVGMSVLPGRDKRRAPRKIPYLQNIESSSESASAGSSPESLSVSLSSSETTTLEKIVERELSDPYSKDRPQILIKYYDLKNKCYVEAKQLSAQLVAKGDQLDKLEEGSDEYNELANERKEMAEKILAHFEVINDCWAKIDYYRENDKLPDTTLSESGSESESTGIDPVALDRVWRNLGSKISRAKKNPEKNQEKLVQLYKESNELAKVLNDFHGTEKYKMRSYDPVKEK